MAAANAALSSPTIRPRRGPTRSGRSPLLGFARPAWRIEDREEQQTGEEAADMGLPGDGDVRAEAAGQPRDDVDGEPDADEGKGPPIREHARQGRGWGGPVPHERSV